MPTAISEIHGIHESEVRERSRMASENSYVPYLSLTQGEFELVLLRDQAEMYARYLENSRYAAAAQMIDNALWAGISNGVNFVGSIEGDFLQQVARKIKLASRKTRPASGDIIIEREGMPRPKGIQSGVRIGDNILPHDSNLDNCDEYAIKYVKKYYNDLNTAQILAKIAVPLLNYNVVKKFNEGKAECRTKREIERLLNDGITHFGHHSLYGFLPTPRNLFPPSITTKNILQSASHSDLARLAESGVSSMRLWLDTAIMRRNAQAEIGPLNQIQSNINWTGLPDEGVREFVDWYSMIGAANAWKSNRIDPLVSPKISELIKKYGQPNVGVEPATTVLVVNTLKTMFVALLAAAPAIISALNNKKSDAFAGARGIGTDAFGPQSGDWDTNNSSGSQSSNNTLLLLGAAAAGLYLLKD